MSMIEKDWVLSRAPHDFQHRDLGTPEQCGFTAGAALDASVEFLCGSPRSAHPGGERWVPGTDNELPGMWEESDFTGGQDETRPGMLPSRSESLGDQYLNQALVRAADAAQYAREPIPAEQRGQIRVRLLNAMPDPYGSVAALCAQYKGQVVRDLAEVSDTDRRTVIDDMLATVLNGPLEVAQFHFQIEGVTRSITHQMVRSRASFFAQESLRFAVPEGDWSDEIPLPPYLTQAHKDLAPGAEEHPVDYAYNMWTEHMRNAARTYQGLIDCGMPAEEARGILPHDMPTRIHWVLDLRTLLTEAGKRTCTQAQFPWRMIFAGIAKALREYGDQQDARWGTEDIFNLPIERQDGWQFRDIADRLRPVCFQTGSCGFMAKFDRSCKIRERVDANAEINRPPAMWGKEADLGIPTISRMLPWAKQVYAPCHPHNSQGDISGRPFHTHDIIPAIYDHEWAADPSAARS